jgi:hypothetical protein
MPFRIPKTPSISTDSPEVLFRDLRNRTIQGLLSHQADTLRAYVETALDEPDVAFELPTGSGKTLVGLLLGEWRRRKYNERVIYLCPTNQLVNQVVEQSSSYGIKVRGFTGSKYDYEPAFKSEYLNAETVSVTSYSALFNTKPFFENPNVVILDDAHSAENYIANMWSMRIERFKDEHKNLFQVFTSVIQDVIAPTDYMRLTERVIQSSWDYSWVEKLPTTEFYKVIPRIIEVLDTHADDAGLNFIWQILRDHLYACHCYISISDILIRPLLPPSNTHAPFADAKQRIYMSATLGEGGELERITGRKNILRLQVQSGWDKQGVGRRLFFFPVRSLDDEKTETLIAKMIKRASRALIIVPDNRRYDEVAKSIQTNLDFPVFSAKEIEKSKKPFVSSEKAIAIVANRYDGIDFINDECRLLILGGFPRATNLQEKFVIQKMGAVALYNGRILTRTQQAFGRCTRSSTDYSAVVIWDEELHNYLLMRDRRNYLHPELQAELDFGIEQAKDSTEKDFLDQLDILLRHDDEWDEAENYIASLRQEIKKINLPGTDDLAIAVQDELEYQYAMWEGDYARALEHCKKILSALTHPELKGYRALWNYLAGSAAWLGSRQLALNLDDQAREYFSNAQRAAPIIQWLVKIAKSLPNLNTKELGDTSKAPILIERLEHVLENLGTLNDTKFSRKEKYILEKIADNDAKEFEEGHKSLGWLLGFDADNENTNGAPDPWWLVDEDLCFVFEDYSNATNPASALPVEKARQAALHPNWIRERLSLKQSARIISVIVTPTKTVDPEASIHLDGVYHWDIENFRVWAKRSLAVIRELRTTFPGSGDLVWRADAISKYKANKIDPDGILSLLELAKNVPLSH